MHEDEGDEGEQTMNSNTESRREDEELTNPKCPKNHPEIQSTKICTKVGCSYSSGRINHAQRQFMQEIIRRIDTTTERNGSVPRRRVDRIFYNVDVLEHQAFQRNKLPNVKKYCLKSFYIWDPEAYYKLRDISW